MKPKLEVRKLDTEGLRQAAQSLGAALLPHFRPDLLLGIRSGGFVVAQMMAATWPGLPLLPITCRRPSTQQKQKSSLVKALLRHLPSMVNDRLRIMEHIVLTQWRKPRRIDFIPDAAELSAIAGFLGRRNGKTNILIVDDAVDSGATLTSVTEAVRAVARPDTVVKTAAITVTTTFPLTQPDFSLYRYVLCRFPWSLDAGR